MSSVTGISSTSSSELMKMLQELARKRSEEAAGVGSTQTSQTGASTQSDFENLLENALTSAGLDSSRIEEVKLAIKSAVSSALSQADESTDARQVVGQAVEQALEKYGVDTDKLKEQMKSQMGSMRPAGPPPGGRVGGGMGGPPDDFDSKVQDALTAAGVDSSQLEEIKSEILSAISSMTEDSDNSSTGDTDKSSDPGGGVKTAVHAVLDKYGIDKDSFDSSMEAGMGKPPGPPPGGQGAGTASSQSSGTSLLNYLGTTDDSTDSYQWLAGLFQFLDEQA